MGRGWVVDRSICSRQSVLKRVISLPSREYPMRQKDVNMGHMAFAGGTVHYAGGAGLLLTQETRGVLHLDLELLFCR